MHRLTLALLLSVAAAAQTRNEATPPRGACVLAGGGKLPPVVFERFLALAGGDSARIVLVPTASSSADDDGEREETLQLYRERFAGAEITLRHTRDRSVADDESFCAPLREATGVWFGGGDQNRLADAYLGTRFERDVMAVLARGGVVGGTSAGTAIQSRVMIGGGMHPPEIATGFDCVPGAIVDQHFVKRQRLPRLLQALAMRPGHFGIGVDEGTAAIVESDVMGVVSLAVVGDSKVVLALPPDTGGQPILGEVAAGERTNLDVWHLAARGHGAATSSTAIVAPPVARGTLLFHSGHASAAAEALNARGIDRHAKIVMVDFHLSKQDVSAPMLLQQDGFDNVHWIHALDLTAGDETALADAAVVWLQLRLVERPGAWWWMQRAPSRELGVALDEVLARGGIVGGDAFGAALLGEHVWGRVELGDHTLEVPLCRGLGLLPGCTITSPAFPGPTAADRRAAGFGIDLGDDAVVEVRGSTVEVLHGSGVTIHLPRSDDATTSPAPFRVNDGTRYDLITGERR